MDKYTFWDQNLGIIGFLALVAIIAISIAAVLIVFAICDPAFLYGG